MSRPNRLSADDEGGIGRTARQGAFWVAAALLGSKVLTVITTIVLARILAPAEYGLVGAAFVVVVALGLFSQLGFGAAIIHHPSDRDVVGSTGLAIMAVIGVLVFAFAFVTAPALAAGLGIPRAGGLVQAMAISFPILALGVVPGALMEREMRYRRKVIPDLGSVAVYATVTLGAALSGAGAYSIAWGQVSQSVVSVVLLWSLAGFRPKRMFNRAVARDLLHYSKFVLGGAVTIYLSTNLANIFVARTLGVTAIAYFALAFNLSNMPATHLGDVVGRVLFPSFVALRDEGARLRRAFISALEVVLFVTVPVIALIAGLAAPIVGTVFGSDWAPMVPLLGLLSGYVVVRVFQGVIGNFLLAVGRPDVNFVTGIIGVCIQAALLWILVVELDQGTEGAALAVSAGALLQMWYSVAVVRGELSFSWVSATRAVAKWLAPGAATFAGARAVSVLVEPDLLAVIAGAALGLAIYAGTYVALNGWRATADAVALITGGRIGRRAPSPASVGTA